jgi:HAE1 family hydrophobic/amphiphilic exporter-1
VFFGVTVSVLLTLVVVPAVYTLLARKSHSPEYVGQLIDKLKKSVAAKPQPGEAG